VISTGFKYVLVALARVVEGRRSGGPASCAVLAPGSRSDGLLALKTLRAMGAHEVLDHSKVVAGDRFELA
jgi:hypothetical protein